MWRRSGPAPAVGALVVLLSGTVTGLAAAGRVGPFSALGGASRDAAAVTTPAALPADRLYPAPTAPPPTQKVVIVPEPGARAGAPAAAAPSAVSPSPGSCWGDDCGGGDSGGGAGGDAGGDG